MPKSKTLGEYLKELGASRKEKPAQIQEALRIYVDLWEEVIEKGLASREDAIDDALLKVESAGGLLQAAQARPTEEQEGDSTS